MGKKIEKVKAFCKEHKKEIAVAVGVGGVIVGGTAGFMVAKKLYKGTLLNDVLESAYRNAGKVVSFTQRGHENHTVYVTNGLKLDEITKLTDYLTEKAELKPNTRITAMVEVTGELIEDC